MLSYFLLAAVGGAAVLAIASSDSEDDSPSKAEALAAELETPPEPPVLEDPITYLGPADDTGAEMEGTAGDDGIQTSGPVFVTFAGEGDDTIVGHDRDEVIFGDEGDDRIFGLDGEGQLFGGDGNDLISGGSDDDFISGGSGSDTLYGGDGDDRIVAGRNMGFQGESGSDLIAAGSGDDVVLVYDEGLDYVSLGGGADVLGLHSKSEEEDGSAVALVTDFDPEEDSLLLGLHDPNPELIADRESLLISWKLTAVETEFGPGTLVEPEIADPGLAERVNAAGSGKAVLVGVTPEELGPDAITVLLTDGDSNGFGDNGWQTILRSLHEQA